MAEKNNRAAARVETEIVDTETIQTIAVSSEKEAKQQAKEALYTVDEFVSSAEKLFEKRPECVRAALKHDGKNSYTINQAKEIVEKFMKKEVK